MKLVYLSNSTFPSKRANSSHVARMAFALGQILPEQQFVLTGMHPDNIIRTLDTPFGDYLFSLSKSEGLPFAYKLFSRSSLPGSLYIYALQTATWIRNKFNPDWVYSRFLQGSILTCMLGFPTVFEFHSDDWNAGGIKGRLTRNLLQQKNLKGVVCISAALKNRLLGDHPEIKIPVLVEHDAAPPYTPGLPVINLGGRCGSWKVGYTGSLYPGKGLNLIGGIASLLRPEDNIDIHIVGGDSKSIEQWKKTITAEFVYFHGPQKPGLVPAYIQAFDLCLLPNQPVITTGSRGRNIGQFTSPLKMFEYMASEKAILVSDLPVLREVLNEQNAILLTHDDPAEWKQAILSLKSHPHMAIQIAKQARITWATHYTWQARATRILNWIGSLPSK